MSRRHAGEYEEHDQEMNDYDGASEQLCITSRSPLSLLGCCGSQLPKDLCRDLIDLLRRHFGENPCPGGRSRVVGAFTELFAVVQVSISGFRIDVGVARHDAQKDA